ncbi:hypothetical protein DFAR_2740004 [Desulfarculales bacterium]
MPVALVLLAMLLEGLQRELARLDLEMAQAE